MTGYDVQASSQVAVADLNDDAITEILALVAEGCLNFKIIKGYKNVFQVDGETLLIYCNLFSEPVYGSSLVKIKKGNIAFRRFFYDSSNESRCKKGRGKKDN